MKFKCKNETIDVFINRVDDVNQNLSSFCKDATETIDELNGLTGQKQHSLEELYAMVSSAYESVKIKRDHYRQQLSTCKSQLSSTPKDIKVTSTSSNGETKTETKSNPAYENLGQQLKNINSKINKCDDVAYELIEEKSILDRLLGDINNSSAKLSQTSNSISRAINALKGLNTKASDSLSKAKNCVNSYLSVSIK